MAAMRPRRPGSVHHDDYLDHLAAEELWRAVIRLPAECVIEGDPLQLRDDDVPAAEIDRLRDEVDLMVPPGYSFASERVIKADHRAMTSLGFAADAIVYGLERTYRATA